VRTRRQRHSPARRATGGMTMRATARAPQKPDET
jgi:hypothetical protein